MFTMLRSTAALGASLALAATALMPQVASAAQTMSVNHGLYASESFVLETSGHDLKNVIHCGPGSPAPFTPCEDIKRFCALLGGDYEPGSCTTPDFPPPPSRD
jgi:hypothetical protein